MSALPVALKAIAKAKGLLRIHSAKNAQQCSYPGQFEFRLSFDREVFAFLEGNINNKRSLLVLTVAWWMEHRRQREQRPQWIGCLLTVLTIVAALLHASILPHRWTAFAGMAPVIEMQNDNDSSVTPPARDPNSAVEEEYQLALQKGTAEALALFIARHPKGPLAEKARATLRDRAR